MHRGEQRAAADARQQMLPSESPRLAQALVTRRQVLVEILDEALNIMSIGPDDYFDPLDVSHCTLPQ